MTATKAEWLRRHTLLDQLNYGALPDILLPYVFDNLGAIQPVVDSVRRAQVEYLRKHAQKEDGELVFADEPGEDTVQTAEGHVVLDDPDAYQSAMEEMIGAEAEVGVTTISIVELAPQLSGTDVRLSELRRTLGWMISSAT